MGNAWKVSKRIRRLRRKYLSVYGEYGNLGLFAVHKIVSECPESIQTHSENTRKEFMRPWRRRKETLGVFSLCAKRYKSEYIFVNNNTNVNLFKILSNYIIWDRLSQKTISRYCPFKGYHFRGCVHNGPPHYKKLSMCITVMVYSKQLIT
jgi:hypothetical protein